MVLVTGGTGFLGAYIIQHLIEKGFAVRAIRRTTALPFFIPEKILSKVEWVTGDVLDILSLQDAMAGIQHVIHAAAVVSFDHERKKEMYQVNVDGTANVVNISVEMGIKRLLHVSSVAALGRTKQTETIDENKRWDPTGNHTHYSLSKYEAEMHVWRGFAEGLDGIIINPSTILGFGDWNQSSCAIFKNGYKKFSWYTHGVNGFVGVEDVAAAVVLLLDSDLTHKRFIVSADNWSFRELFNNIADHFKNQHPQREASKLLGSIAWRMEKVRSFFTGTKPMLTKETAKIAHSKTSFDNRNLLRVLPGFNFTPLSRVIKNSCEKYLNAVETGVLK